MSETLCDEYLLEHLSHRPPHQLVGRISIADPAKPSTLKPHHGPSSLGLLDPLPLEILHGALNDLDFQSLSRLSCASKRGRSVVEALPAYRELMKHAPDTLKALGQSSLISVHSARKLRAVLRSEACSWCGEYGPFLFLPTCERCCYECQRINPSLWVMTVDLAKHCFRLTASQLKEIPIMRSIRGVYDVPHELSRWQRLKLVSVRAAKELSLKAKASNPVVIYSANNSNLDHFLNTPLCPPPNGMLPLHMYTRTRTDECRGMASICFPSLQPDNTVEYGLWCRGCYQAPKQYRFHLVSAGPAIVNLDMVSPRRALVGTSVHARSKSEFLTHITHCDGARELLFALKAGVRT
ncbi:hypothetical protein FQN49_008217 [Arthroderma sp. PD_2]|nr:hypothetical protein FQN49_008217 [Arthroderma sp. PD_2]